MEKTGQFADHDACGVGFVTRLGAPASREVVARALTALERLAHRGGLDADGQSGDGAGILVPIPDGFFRARGGEIGVRLPETFGLGMAFLPPGAGAAAREVIEQAARRSGLKILGWRAVPTDPSVLGPRALETLPEVWQCFVGPGEGAEDFERSLFLLRKRVEAQAAGGIYFCSLSCRTVVYKGLLSPQQLTAFYSDLAVPDFTARFAIFHQRYSTNTQPSWNLAQPFRLVAHNGEINTLSGNRRWMRARARSIRKELDVGDWFPVLEEGVSDSASFDNALELLLRRGHGVAAAMYRLVPPAWEGNRRLDARLRQFFEEQAGEQEPWDGPAAMVFTDGRRVGAKLDRNGLRPLRFTLTRSGLLVAGSETGLADFTGEEAARRGRLGPGEMLLADPGEGALYRGRRLFDLLPREASPARTAPSRLFPPDTGAAAGADAHGKRKAAAFGWTGDQFRLLYTPLPRDGKEAIWSMGDDAPPAFLSAARRPLWDYFKQRFAQVTNPAIDPLRESHVMSLRASLARVALPSPLVDSGQMARIEAALAPICRIDLTFPSGEGADGGARALERIAERASAAAADRAGMVLLSDRAVSEERAAVPAMLGLAAAWKAICDAGACDIPVIVESGQVIETHHLAMLVAAGAAAVFPYLALAFAQDAAACGAANYRAAVEDGLRKVLARMGISTLASYRNSQLFEIVGLDPQLAKEFFPDAEHALGGRDLDDIFAETLDRHARAFAADWPGLADAGFYRFRQGGERHSSAPESIRRLHRYVANGSAEDYRGFADLAHTREPVAVRDLLEVADGNPVPVEEVEDESAILSRFSTQAMSLGALSPEAHRTLAIAMNRLGARSNTGEGGEDPELYDREPEASNRVKQVASARFGVSARYLVHADELEIKMAQGSKPGEGGQLPAGKVTGYIARLRHAAPGTALISPPPHHDIYSIEDLAQLMYDLRAVNPRARIGVKLVAGAGVGIIAAGVAKAGADVVTICGFDGGTGASALTSIKNTGLPWEVGLRDAHSALIRAGFRDRVRLRVDGGLKFARDVIVAALLGADEFGFGTAALLAIGCVMARQCHLNTCPVGIATQDEKLRARFAGQPEMAMAFFRALAGDVRERLALLGARRLEEIVGAAGRLRPRDARAARSLGGLLHPLPPAASWPSGAAKKQTGLCRRLAPLAGVAERETLRARPRVYRIRNSDRSIGAHLSGQLLRRCFRPAAEREPAHCRFRGIAGQSFGAFLIDGLVFQLAGEANDYVGKGLSGGTIAVTAGSRASRRGDTIVGNTVLYGATSGELYVAGRAGERFAVRNSGALAVVEGTGQHGCEYMTAGVVLILGPTGINLGSGMTGGLAYVLRSHQSARNCHRDFVRTAEVGEEEAQWLRLVLQRHLELTGSPRAAKLLRWERRLPITRLEPLDSPCSIGETWAPILTRLGQKAELPVVAPWLAGEREEATAGFPSGSLH
jgi:glutamate synthase (ferredoxin)